MTVLFTFALVNFSFNSFSFSTNLLTFLIVMEQEVDEDDLSAQLFFHPLDVNDNDLLLEELYKPTIAQSFHHYSYTYKLK